MKLKKLAAIFLSAVMAVSVTTSAFADTTGPQTGSITVTGVHSGGRQLVAYKLIDATKSGEEPSATYGYTTINYPDKLKTAYYDATNTNLAPGDDVLQKIQDLTADQAKVFANSIQEALESNAPDPDVQSEDFTITGTDPGSYTYTATGVPLGYYIIFDKTAGSAEYAPTFAMLSPADTNAQATAKDSNVTSDKTVADTADNAQAAYQHTGSVDIGDIVTYKITGDIPAYASTGNDQYKVKLTDTLPNNGQLQYVGIESVELKGDDITHTFQAEDVTFKDKDGKTTNDMTEAVSFVFDKNVVDKENENNIDYLNDKPATITITYTAKVISAEQIVDSNTNTFTYEYGKPDNTFKQDSKRATVYTYGFKVFKFTQESDNKTPLAGAVFNLEKNGTALTFTEQKNANGDVAGYAYAALDEDGKPVTGTVTDLVSGEDGYVKIYGLDAGTYTLEETKAPNGYNLLADTIDVTITAKEGSDDAANGDCTVSYKPTHGDGNMTEAAEYTVDVLNTTGTQLPGTGGMGTTPFIVGGLLILCAAGAFLFFNRKRVFGK